MVENPKIEVGNKKLDLSLVPPSAIVALAEAFRDGEKKYSRFNWRKSKVPASVYYAALQRHMCAWYDGEDYDPESNVNHLAHAMACLAILVDASLCDTLADDRPPRTDLGSAIRDCTQ